MKEYKNEDITIVWKSNICAHAGICARSLPSVFKPKEQPWITMENATTERLIKQVNKCPSGALSFYYNNEDSLKDAGGNVSTAKATMMKDGPLVIEGLSELKNIDGEELELPKTVAFCRCGSSQNKPFCDGSHYKVGFKG